MQFKDYFYYTIDIEGFYLKTKTHTTLKAYMARLYILEIINKENGSYE